jgi:hypothetical protein
LDLVPGFDVMLGDDWSTANRVLADYTHNVLWLQGSKVKLVPHSNGPVQKAPGENIPSSVLEVTATQAAKLLAAPRYGCTPAFTVVVKQSNPTIQSQQDPRIQSLLDKYADVFEPPSMATVREEITPEAIPIPPGVAPTNRPAFRISAKERQVLEEHIQEQLDKGWITRSNSSYGAPVLFIPKPDGTLRMCIDYRALNRITTKNKYPLPRIDDLLDNLSGAKFFTSLDLTSGYHQLVLRESDRPKTAFNTHMGKFEYKVLPMGLTNAPAVFQAAMNRVFGRHMLFGKDKYVCVYLDDILIFSKTEAAHVVHIEHVLKLLRQHQLKAKLKKCEIFKTELKFLGHIVSADGMSPEYPPSRIGPLQSVSMKCVLSWVLRITSVNTYVPIQLSPHR